MGVSNINYVVQGIYFKTSELEPFLNESIDDFLEKYDCDVNLIYVSPMDDQDFIYGIPIVKTKDGRWDDNSIPLTNVSKVSKHKELIQILPKELRDAWLYNRIGEYGYWAFTQYS